MECPRCRLLNPDSAERCDCGYDFRSGNVETPYFKEKLEVPRWIPILIAVGGCLGSCRTVTEVAANEESNPASMALLLIWWGIVFVVYRQLATGKNWAKFVLAILTFPIGLAFLLSRSLYRFIRLRKDENKAPV